MTQSARAPLRLLNPLGQIVGTFDAKLFQPICAAVFSTDLKKKRAAEFSFGRPARYCR
ncbi:MAG: hypothetical protein ABSB74_05060 [Tepidisphaeraceae bacterium]